MVTGIEAVRGSNFNDRLLGSGADEFFFPDFTDKNQTEINFPRMKKGGASSMAAAVLTSCLTVRRGPAS